MRQMWGLFLVGFAVVLPSLAAVPRPDRSRSMLGVHLNYGRGITAGGGFAVDAAFNYYVSGHWEGETRFEDQTVRSSGPRSGFVSSYDHDQRLRWTRVFPGTTVPRVAVVGSVGVVMAGHFKGATRLGTNELVARASHDCFIARLDDRGEVIWFRRSAGPGPMNAWGLATDAAGNAYVTGELNGEAMLDGTLLRSEGPRNLFLAKYSSEGRLLWALRDGAGFVEPRGVAVDAVGGVFVTGNFFNTARFEAGTFGTPPQTTDMFLAKYDHAGRPLWARAAGWERSKTGHNVAVDGAGNVHVVGLFQTNRVRNQDNVYLARYSPAGELLGVRPYQKGDADFSNIVSVPGTAAGASPKRETNAAVVDGSAVARTARAALRSVLATRNAIPAEGGPPELGMTRSGDFAVLYWADAASGWVLESSDPRTPFPIWVPVAATPESLGALQAVAVPLADAGRFFRLRTR